MRTSSIYLLLALFQILSVVIVFCFTQFEDCSDSTTHFSQDQQEPLRRREKRELNPYYDFLINEWSFKFWAVFQLVTIAILLYSTFAAIYYAKYTYLHTVPSDEDLFLRKRSLDQAIDRWADERIKDRPNLRNK